MPNQGVKAIAAHSTAGCHEQSIAKYKAVMTRHERGSASQELGVYLLGRERDQLVCSSQS